MLEKDNRVTVEIVMLYFFRTRLNEAYIANVTFAKSARPSICCPELYFFKKKYLVTLHF